MIDQHQVQLRRRSLILLLFVAVLWSSSGLLIKLISWQPLAIFGARSSIAAVLYWTYLRPSRFELTRWQLIGAASYAGMQLLFISATKLTTAANAIFLQYTSPVYVMILGIWLLGERPQRADWLALPVILAGLSLFFGDQLSLDGVTGNLMAVLSGVAMAVMVLSLRRQREGRPAETVLIGNVLGSLVGLPFLLQETLTLPDVAIIAYLGLFQLGLSFLLYAWAIRHLQALESTLILTLEPVLNPLWVFLVIGEMPGPLARVGAVLVLGGVALRALAGARYRPLTTRLR